MPRLVLRVSSTVLLAASFACAPAPASTPEAAPAVDPVERGAYLVTLAGCDDCHTPKLMTEMGPVPDMSRRMSGHPAGEEMGSPPELSEVWFTASNAHFTAWTGPWGTSYAFNLTPEEITGIGIWTEQMFIDAMRTGKHMGTSRPILPPMPWQNFGQATDEDLKAMFAFLRSLPPVVNQVPLPDPPPAMQ